MIREEQTLAMLHLAESAALVVGQSLKHRRSDWQSLRESSGHDVKIDADRRSEKLIIERLEAGSSIRIFSEESGRVGRSRGKGKNEKTSDLQWIIDPLDGSLNYSRGIPICCVSIALYQGKDAILGVVYDFNHDELFSGLVQVGAWCNQRPIAPSEVDEISEAVLGTGFPVNTDFSTSSISSFVRQIQRFRKVRLLGSAALSLCFVACGRLDAYEEENIMFWDVAAGCAIVNASGGRVQLDSGRTVKDSCTVFASNGRLRIG